MSIQRNFLPFFSANITTTSSSQSVVFNPAGSDMLPGYMITNKGSNGAYVAFGAGAVTAITTTSTPAANCLYVAAGAVVLFDAPRGNFTLAAIQDTGSTILEITIGKGN